MRLPPPLNFKSMGISSKALIKMGKWKMLLTSLKEGEYTFEVLNKNQAESLRQTIARTNGDRPDKHFKYESCYRGKVFVVTKTRRTNNEGEHSESD